MYHMKSRLKPYINISSKRNQKLPLHGCMAGDYNRIIRWNLLLYKLPGRIFSCINLKSCNRQGDGGRDGVPALALTVTEKYFWIA